MFWCASVATDSGRGWQHRADGGFWPHGAQKGARSCPRKCAGRRFGRRLQAHIMTTENNAERPEKRSAFAVSPSVAASGALGGLCGTRPSGLRKRGDFLSVQRSGVRHVTPGFVLQVSAPSPEASSETEKDLAEDDNEGGGTALRIGYTVSRKVGGAVQRNRVKRKLRELGRLVLAVKATSGRDYVLIGRRAALHRPMDRIVRDLEQALKKLKVAKDE